jgi:hypothetical protein
MTHEGGNTDENDNNNDATHWCRIFFLQIKINNYSFSFKSLK